MDFYTLLSSVVETPHVVDNYTSHDNSTSHSGSDDHASGAVHAAAHVAKLFGGVVQTETNVPIYTLMLVIIIVSVNAVEFLFDGLLHLTHDTPFSKMIHAIEKELMIVGFTAFIFKIIINSSDILTGYSLHALEFAGIHKSIFCRIPQHVSHRFHYRHPRTSVFFLQLFPGADPGVPVDASVGPVQQGLPHEAGRAARRILRLGRLLVTPVSTDFFAF